MCQRCDKKEMEKREYSCTQVRHTAVYRLDADDFAKHNEIRCNLAIYDNHHDKHQHQ